MLLQGLAILANQRVLHCALLRIFKLSGAKLDRELSLAHLRGGFFFGGVFCVWVFFFGGERGVKGVWGGGLGGLVCLGGEGVGMAGCLPLSDRE